MNKDRRKRIDDVILMIDGIMECIFQIQEEEEQTAENMPENLQESEKVQHVYEIAEELRDIVNELDDLNNRLVGTKE